MNKETKKEIKNNIICNLYVFGISMIFSLLSMALDIISLPKILRAVLGIVMSVPILFSLFVLGRSKGEKLYKKYANADFDNLHRETQDKIPFHKVVYCFVGFAVWSLLFTVIAVISKNTVIQYFVTVLEYPVFMVLRAFGVVSTESVSPILLVMIVFMILEVGMFVLGYFVGIRTLKMRQRSIERELRSYDN